MEENKNVVEEKEDVVEGEKNVVSPKKNKGVTVIIVGILLIVAALGGFFAGELLRSDKGDNKEKNNVDNTENGNVENTENGNVIDNPADYTITKEDAEEFLNKYGDYLYVLNNDEYDESNIFYFTISYLVQHQMYTKTGDLFTFKESDIKDLIPILYMKDTVKYGSEGLKATYDAENKTLSMSIHIDLLNEDPGPERTITKTIKDFKFENGIAEIVYNRNYKYNEVVHDQNGQVINESNTDYTIKLYKVDNELRIKEINSNSYNN